MSSKKPVKTPTPMRPGRNGGQLKTGGNNGGGRPKKLPALDVLMETVMGEEKDGITAMEAILKALRAKASKGDVKAAEMLLDRAYGKPRQSIDHTSDSKPIPTLTFIPVSPKGE